MPTPQAVREFKELYLARYGVLLSDQEALERAGRLLHFYKTVYTGNPTEVGTNTRENSWTDQRTQKNNSILKEK